MGSERLQDVALPQRGAKPKMQWVERLPACSISTPSHGHPATALPCFLVPTRRTHGRSCTSISSPVLVLFWSPKAGFGPQMQARPLFSEGVRFKAAGCPASKRRQSNPRQGCRGSWVRTGEGAARACALREARAWAGSAAPGGAWLPAHRRRRRGAAWARSRPCQ